MKKSLIFSSDWLRLSDRFAVRSVSPVRSLRCQTNFVMGVKDE